MFIHKSTVHDGRAYACMTPQQLAEAGVPEPLILAAVSEIVIADAHAKLRAIAHRVFTLDPVQAVIYDAKFNEAQAYVAAGAPANVSAADYPILVAEAQARGIPKGVLANLILTKGAAWRAFAGALEAARARVAIDVAAAPDAEAAQAVADAVVAGIDTAAQALL